MLLRKTILIVDDDEDDRMFIREAFKEVDEYLEIVDMRAGTDLIRLIGKGTIPVADLIVIDMNMPVMNGFEVFEEVEPFLAKPSVAWVMLSSSNDVVLHQQALNKGLDAFFLKPYLMEGYVEIARSLKIRFL